MLVTARLVDLNVASADGRRQRGTGSDLQHSGCANHDVQVELVLAGTTIVIIDGARDKRNGDGVGRIAANAAQDAVAVEVDNAHIDFRG